MKASWVIVIAFVSLLVGLSVGYGWAQPTDLELAKKTETDKATQDLIIVSGDYQKLFGLCEDKYQLALDGDLNSALRLNGQMDVLQAEINQILNKYKPTLGL